MAEKSALDSLFGTSNPSKIMNRFVSTENEEKQDAKEVVQDLESKKLEDNKDKKIPEEPKVDETERLERTIFIGNLPTTLKSSDVKKLFEPQSIVETIRFRNIQLQKNSKLNRKTAVRRHEIDENGTCSAYVVLKNKDNIEDFVNKLNGTKHFEHIIRVDFAKPPGEKTEIDKETNKKTVFVGHLPFDATEEEVYDIFKVCGDIHHIRILKDERGRSRGVAYVTFKDESAVQFALKFNKANIRKETLTVQRSNPGKAEQKKSKEMKKQNKKKDKIKKNVKNVKKVNVKENDKKEKKTTKSFEGKRAKSHEDDKNQSIKNYLKMRAHIKKKKQLSNNK